VDLEFLNIEEALISPLVPAEPSGEEMKKYGLTWVKNDGWPAFVAPRK
jgi:hypothetical protein